MEDRGKIICRLCLTNCEDDFHPIKETTQETMYFLLLNLDLAVSSAPVMCHSCAGSLKRCFNFKMECLSAQSHFPNNTFESNEVNILSDLDLCFFCMTPEKCTLVQELETQNVKIVGLLEKYFPELNMGAIEEPMICNPCYDSLLHHLVFITNCLAVEKRIKEYYEIEGTNFKERANLCYVVDYNSKEVLNICKREEMFLETTKYADINVEVKRENFMDMEEYELVVEPEYVSIKVEEGACDSSQDSVPPPQPEPVTLAAYKEIPQTSLDKSKTPSLQTMYESNLNSGNVSPTTKKKFQCYMCLYQTNYKHHLGEHMLTHKSTSEVTMYKCEECDYQTKRKSNLTDHMFRHKNNSEVTMYNCALCMYKTKYKRYLQQHEKCHKDISEVTTYECEKCPFRTRYRSSVQYHVLLAHKESAELNTDKCETCSCQTKRKSCPVHRKRRRKSTAEIIMYNCEMCPYKTKNKYNLQQHILRHKDPSEVIMEKCELCPFQTRYKLTLGKHMVIHRPPSEIAVQECKHCDSQCECKEILQEDMVIYKNVLAVNMYKCVRCEFRTDNMWNYQTHVLNHKIYNCNSCEYSTKRVTDLQVHMRTHM